MKRNHIEQCQSILKLIPMTTAIAFASCETPELNNEEPDNNTDTVVFPSFEPNIILMLADDMGFDDMSYRGNSSVSTPRLDSLAQMSTRFENFYVHSVSAPTRASLLTGRHFIRCGISGLHSGRDYMNLDEVTIADALKQAGYQTGIWGKWHSGTSSGYYPWERGFDEAYMASLYHHNYNNGLYKGTYNGIEYNGSELSFDKSEGIWTDAKMTDMAIDFIARNKSDKFFAFIPFLAPHESWAAPDEYIQKYQSMGQSENFATLNGMLSHLDYQVGRVIDAVDSLGIAENTIIIFMSDNGPNYNESLLNQSEWASRNPSGYKGKKSRNTENGIHSPLFVYWKGCTIPISNYSVLGVCDIFPTLCELAGASIPSSAKPLDGTSFRDIIASPSTKDIARTLYISHWAPFNDSGDCLDNEPLTSELIESIDPELQHIGIRRGNDKLLLNEYNETDIALWNLSSDYGETNNLYNNGTSEDKTKALAYKEELLKWYTNIINDEGALSTTTFQIGDPNYQYSEILCYAPIEISDGLTNESQQLIGFDSAEEYATYSVNILREGNYDLRIYLSGCSAEGSEVFSVSTNLADDLNNATFYADKSSSKWCKVPLSLEVKTLTIKFKTSTSSPLDLKYIRLEYLDN